MKTAPRNAPDSNRLQSIYQPLIYQWLIWIIRPKDEVADLAQEILLIVFRELPHFDRLRDGAFRAWLRKITLNRLRTYWRQQKRTRLVGASDERDDLLASLEDSSSQLALTRDRQHDQHVLQKLLMLAAPDFGETTWEAFRRFAIEGRPSAQVAADLRLTENAVQKAKSLILRRLREEAAGLID